MSSAKEREEFLELEKTIVNNLLLSRINKDGKEDVHIRYLKEAMKGHNELIKEYFSSKKNIVGPKQEDLDLTSTEDVEELIRKVASDKDEEDLFYDNYRKYMDLLVERKALSKKYNVKKDMIYQTHLISFVSDYEISKRFLELTEWYFAHNEETEHNIEQFVEIATHDSTRLFAFRNEIVGIKTGLELDEECLKGNNRKLLISSMKMRLAGEFWRGNIRMISELYDNEEDFSDVSGVLLFDLINTATFISLAKEYGFEEQDLDVEGLIDRVKNSINFFPTIEGYDSTISELDNMKYNASVLAMKFDNHKRMNLS